MRFLTSLMAALVLALAAPTLAHAETDTIPPARTQVLDCVATLDRDSSWPECLRLIFAPCAGLPVGSEPHIGCLASERRDWRAVMDGEQTGLMMALTTTASTELTGVMSQWYGYVGQKCGEVAADKADISADAAQLGCEISEIVGVTAEFAACRAGRSTAPYCILQE